MPWLPEGVGFGAGLRGAFLFALRLVFLLAPMLACSLALMLAWTFPFAPPALVEPELDASVLPAGVVAGVGVLVGLAVGACACELALA